MASTDWPTSSSHDVRLQVAVQHDPRRAHILPPLLSALPRGARVVTDPGATEPLRSPWRCYRACLETLGPATTHLAVLQDDAEPCLDFAATVRAAITARPDDLLALFVPGIGENARRIQDACERGSRWAHLSTTMWVPAVALVWPRALIPRLLAYYDARHYPAARTADDGIIGDWSRDEGVRVLATVPSLCEHNDREPSLMGKHHLAGANPARVAACWAAPPWSPRELEW